LNRPAYRPDRTGSVMLAIVLLVLVLALAWWFLFTGGENGNGDPATPFPPSPEVTEPAEPATPEAPEESPGEDESPPEETPEG
jgi:cytoskeletal protein RodZ